MRPLFALLCCTLAVGLLVADDRLAPDPLARLKAATVYTHVEAAGLSGSGIAFLIAAQGDAAVIVTNQHVITPEPKPVDFNRDVRPILSNRCFKCHGPAKQEAGVRLDSLAAAQKRKAIVPGKLDDSKLIDRIGAHDDERMPPADAGPPLTQAQIDILRRWVASGANYAPHWAFVAPRATELPAVRKSDWPKNGVDQFLLARLEREGISPAPPAAKATLIRRVSLDLLGLLPTPEEVADFEQDARPDAYERLIDRLLFSPHYGERQARHWLDLARYADSNGYTIDGPRTVWPYRDWVIAAFNRDLPFDQFTVEQLAGDLLPNPTREQQIATGFHRNTPFNEEGGTDPEQFRVERTIDRTNTTAATWLGLTAACAQCHDHKYDPLAQREYYSLNAFFNSVDEPKLTMGTTEEQLKLKELRARVTKAKKAKLSVMAIKLLERQVKDYEERVHSTLVLKEAAKPRASFVHLRGDFLAKGPAVVPSTPAWLPALGVSERPANRLDLARWLTRPDQPLTPRVVVNRAWQQFFGTGLVETENDFGMQGAVPTHPELLDWLAADFVHAGWSTKRLHRLIVTSAAYRQSSLPRPDLRERDPNNRLLARQNRLRFDAETLRDAALCASGLLSPKIGGAPVYPPQAPEVFTFTQNKRAWPESKGPDRFRRAIYTYIWRQSQHPLTTTFDGADAQTACTRRNRSNTPLQALHLANDPVFVELAAGLGARVLSDGPTNDAGRATLAFRRCFARQPTAVERDYLANYARSHGWAAAGRVLLNLDEFITRD